MIDDEGLDIITTEALNGIQAMALPEPVAALVIVARIDPSLDLRHQRFAVRYNLADSQVRTVLELLLETLERKTQQHVGQA